MYIDTHAHLYLPQFSHDLDEVINRAHQAGVEEIYLPNIDASSIEDVLKLQEKYPDRCKAMIGLHPCSVKEGFEEELKKIFISYKIKKFIAVGEIGIDLYWDSSTKDIQFEAFHRQCKIAEEFTLPIVIHSRESIPLILDFLEQHRFDLQGVFHCFTGSKKDAQRITDLGFIMGIGGVVTYKNCQMDDVLRYIGSHRIILETDAPYLSPVPKRGKRNESSYLIHTAEYVANILDLSGQELAEITTRNAREMFSG